MKNKRLILFIAAAVGFTLFVIVVASLIFFISRNRQNVAAQVEPLPEGATAQALRLTVQESGITVVTAEQIAQANLLTDDLQTDALNLTRDGETVPYLIQDEALYFYAEAITRSLEGPAVYWLAPGEGVAMSAESGATAGEGLDRGRVTHLWEENALFVSLARGDDAWFGQLMNAGESADIALEGISPLAEEATLTVRVWSNNETLEDPDHHLQLFLNEELVGEHFWDGKKQETVSFTIDGELFRTEGNTLKLTIPGDTGALGEQVYLDWIQLEYGQALDLGTGALRFAAAPETIHLAQANEQTIILDVTQPTAPIRLIGETQGEGVLFAPREGTARLGQFAAANPDQALQPLISVAPVWADSLTTDSAGTDYLAIYANQPDFLTTLQPLLDYRQEQGLSVRAVDVTQIYDEFSYGRPTPEGIRSFLLYAAANWNPAPRFVLLVGDASYDFNDFTEGKNSDILPTQLVFTDFMGYVASDTWFVIAPDGDLYPEMAIGRFPAQDAQQLETMVSKTLIYERDTDRSWSNRALLVADDEEFFDETSDELAVTLSDSGFTPEKLYMDEREDIREDIVTLINDGVGLVNYIGHGSVEVWGDEKVLQASDASDLRNRGRFPIFTTFTCLNGYFNHPDVDALAETLLTAPNGGVAAAIAPSSRTTTHQQFLVADIFFAQLLGGEVSTLGEALQIAKQENATNSTARDVIYSYNLLGDPALQFHLP